MNMQLSNGIVYFFDHFKHTKNMWMGLMTFCDWLSSVMENNYLCIWVTCKIVCVFELIIQTKFLRVKHM